MIKDGKNVFYLIICKSLGNKTQQEPNKAAKYFEKVKLEEDIWNFSSHGKYKGLHRGVRIAYTIKKNKNKKRKQGEDWFLQKFGMQNLNIKLFGWWK